MINASNEENSCKLYRVILQRKRAQIRHTVSITHGLVNSTTWLVDIHLQGYVYSKFHKK